MALQVWLPLNGTLENKGLSNVTVTNNGATVDNNGKIGKCYSFDGNDDYIAFSGNFFRGGTSYPFSICMWVYQNDTNRAILFGDYNLSGTLNFNIELRAATNPNIRFYWEGSPDLDLGTLPVSQWVHLCITYDGTTLKHYNNGTLVNSVTTSLSNKIKSSGDFYIGRDSRTGATALAGKVNDVRLYDHALSPKEVKEINKGLILHYKLDGNDIGITIPRNGDLIPDGVELYEYLQSDGNAYIDTSIPYDSTKSTYKVETKFSQPANVGSYDAIFGAYTDENSKTLRIIRGNNNSVMWSYYNTKAGGGVCGRIETANSNIREVVLTSTTTIVTENGTTTTHTHPAVNGNNTTSKFYLFCQGTTSGEIYCKSKSRIYYIRFYDNNILIGNFIPCTYLGEPGMWDTVENKFYRNQGTGQFTLGNKITLKEYEYLEANSSAYIKTGYIPNSETKVISQFISPKLYTQPLFGGREAYQSKDFSFWPTASTDTDIRSNYNNDVINQYYDISNVVSTVIKDKNILSLSNSRGNWDLISPYATFTAPVEMYLFQINNNGTLLGPYTNGALKLYYLKIYNNGTLVRDFIPVSYNGTPGLWDKVEWKFYGNAGSGSFTLGPEKTVQQDAPIFYDSSGYCNHGSITGTLTTNSDSPRYTKSTVFNGSSAINAGHTAKVTDAITISYWAKTSTEGVAVSCTQNGGFSSSSNGTFYMYANGTYGTIPNGGVWNNNAWHHIVNTFDGRYKKIYKDGALAATQDLGAKYAIQYNASAPIWIGAESQASNTPTTPYFNGSISDVRIYATALSEDDVKELYNTSAFVTNNGVFAEYELYEDNLSDVKKRGLLETANFYENGAESGYALDTDKTRVASNYIISEDFIEI